MAALPTYFRCWGSWMAVLQRPLLLLGPAAGRTCFSCPLQGTGLELAYCSFQSKSCAGQLTAHDEAVTGAWMQRGEELGPIMQTTKLLLKMVISLHCLNWRVIKILQATCTLGIHRRRLLPGDGQEICTQRQSSLRNVACE